MRRNGWIGHVLRHTAQGLTVSRTLGSLLKKDIKTPPNSKCGFPDIDVRACRTIISRGAQPPPAKGGGGNGDIWRDYGAGRDRGYNTAVFAASGGRRKHIGGMG